MEFFINIKTDVENYIEANFGAYARKDGSIARKEVHLDYYTRWEKFIPVKPRKVLLSRNFGCPPELNDSWKLLQQVIRSGRDLNPYRSNAAVTMKTDQLLYEWNIVHLHFKIGKRDKDANSDWLLFCTIDEKAFYAIQIGSHGSIHNSCLFSEIVHNWPHLVREIAGDNWR